MINYQAHKSCAWLTLKTHISQSHGEHTRNGQSINRDKDLIATTDAHQRPVRVHAQRPGKGLQAKQTESLRAQNSAIQKPDQKTEITCLTVYTITPMY